ncbi:MAG: hypothetical protein U5R48_13550 [Gammaproteobacteria bacterium]|nr:hypothetical protein [Gammaproteobacteria bacterium]
MVDKLNSVLKQEAVDEAERNVADLRPALTDTQLLTLQQTLRALLERELQTLMLAAGNDEYAFRVIDPAQVPIQRHSPWSYAHCGSGDYGWCSVINFAGTA